MLGGVDGDSDGDRLSWGVDGDAQGNFSERDRRGNANPEFELPHQSIVTMKHLQHQAILVMESKTIIQIQ